MAARHVQGAPTFYRVRVRFGDAFMPALGRPMAIAVCTLNDRYKRRAAT